MSDQQRCGECRFWIKEEGYKYYCKLLRKFGAIPLKNTEISIYGICMFDPPRFEPKNKEIKE